MLYSFCSKPSCSDGFFPRAGLIFDSKGNLYGTATDGGAPGCSGCGLVFKLSPPALASASWKETILHSFTGSDGAFPAACLIFDSKGNLYSTTEEGGASGGGVVFQLTDTGFVPPVPFSGFLCR